MKTNHFIPVLLFTAMAFAFASCLNDPEDPNKQLNQEIKQIDDYLAAMGITQGVLYDNGTGIRFVFNSYGDDVPPKEGQTVKLNYAGKLFSDGTPFESGQQHKVLNEISPDVLKYCARNMLKGTSVTVYVPSKYGYGAQGTASVPPHSILVYNLYLQDVIRTSEQQHQFQTDTAAIHNFIKENGVSNAVQHSSGMWYTIQEYGSGGSPTPYSTATFDYTLRLLNNHSDILQQGTINNGAIFGNLIDAFAIGLPLLSTGTKATFYIPSGLAYGTNGQGPVPANANLIFEVKLTSFN